MNSFLPGNSNVFIFGDLFPLKATLGVEINEFFSCNFSMVETQVCQL